MEEAMIISVNSTKSRDGSDSRSNNLQPFLLDIVRRDSVLSTSRFKGVICQSNGHWGAQIYVNHQRIWLGTFKSEQEAAMAYDSAALKLRSGESHRNVPWTNTTVLEPHFQSGFSTEAVLSMIRDGSYASKFGDYLKAQLQNGHGSNKAHPNREIMGKQLFQKELTPSDVGKLNRLVIPKKFAVKYFPHISEDPEQNEGGQGAQDTDLEFIDSSKRTWKFRYCYWKSSQSYVFTRGWNRFVKDKGLRAKDVVIFSLVECKNSSDEVKNLCVIDVEYRDGTCSSAVEEADHIEKRKFLNLSLSNISCDKQGTSSSSQAEEGLVGNASAKKKICLGLKLSLSNMSCNNQGTSSSSQAEEGLVENASARMKICFGTQQKRLRLFGVQID